MPDQLPTKIHIKRELDQWEDPNWFPGEACSDQYATYVMESWHDKKLREAALFAWKRLGRMERGILPMQEFEEVFADFLAKYKEQNSEQA
jgi:hypothetical protein